MMRLERVFIYSDKPSDVLFIPEIVERLRDLGIDSQFFGDYYEYLNLNDEKILQFSQKSASVIINDIEAPLSRPNSYDETEVVSEYESIKASAPYNRTYYDGNWLQRIYFEYLAPRIDARKYDTQVHLIFTSRLFLTYEAPRYHARVILGGIPSLISTSGIVEAPARPREYYFMKARLVKSGMDVNELDALFQDRFLRYDDPRISSAMLSYALASIFYQITGQRFCDNANCRLYNSHLQEEMLRVQVNGELCESCAAKLEGFV